MTLQQKKVKKFASANKSFDRYKAWNENLLKAGKITKEEFAERLSKRAKMLDL